MATELNSDIKTNPRTDLPFPKVLIVGQPFNNETGGGITLSNLFEGWPKDRLAVLCSGYLINPNTDFNSCNNYYQIGEKEHKWVFPFNLFKRKYYSGRIDLQKDTSGPRIVTPAPPNWRKKIILNYFYPTLEFLGIYDLFSSFSLSPQLSEWIDEYNPDIVYAQASSRNTISFCSIIQRYLNKPFVFHMMDDWPSMIRHQGLLGKYWEKKVNHEIKTLFDQADLLLSISDQMAAEYKKRYSQDFVTFHNPIDLDFWTKHRRTNFELSKKPTILYAGRVGTGIDESLETIAMAVQQINNELDIQLTFVLQTAEKPSWAFKYTCVEHKLFVPYKDLPFVFSNSDFLILPYDFSVKSIKFIGFSMPTKAPEYMASGSPVIIFAPKVTALVKYASRNNCAKIITEDKVESLKEGIKELILDKNLRETISNEAVRVVDQNHNATEVKRNFRSLISSLTNH